MLYSFQRVFQTSFTVHQRNKLYFRTGKLDSSRHQVQSFIDCVLNYILHGYFTDNRIINALLNITFIKAKAAGSISLRITVNQKYLAFQRRQARSQIYRRSSLANTTLLVGNSNYLYQFASPRSHSISILFYHTLRAHGKRIFVYLILYAAPAPPNSKKRSTLSLAALRLHITLL